ncbi:Plexin-B1 [Bagarius yarrelli]|uniref:Plexin-B1 n=1 Tax=Bagarius yarrelli TaxID=175774 RepID=A0A556VAB7_BAGYA|nr:Plexin-B1 [Bagarius yarrelli]
MGLSLLSFLILGIWISPLACHGYPRFSSNNSVFQHLALHPDPAVEKTTGPVRDNRDCLPPVTPENCPHAQRSLKSTYREYRTYIARMCLDDHAYYSCSKVPLACYSRVTGKNYNILQGAQVDEDVDYKQIHNLVEYARRLLHPLVECALMLKGSPLQSL